MAPLPVRILALLLALVGPALVFGAALRWYNRTEPWVATDVVQRQEAALPPSSTIVILGSSWARTDIDGKELARGLGLKPAQVATLSQAKSVPAMWYAMARYRLFSNPKLHPKLIVIVSGLPGLIVTRPDSRDLSALEQHYEAPDEVLLKKAYGIESAPWVARTLSRRAEPRDAAVAWVRARLVDLLVRGREGETAQEVQEAAADEVFAEVEGNGNAQMARLLPVVEKDDTPDAGVGGTIARTADETFLGDIAALAAEHDARVVVAIPPVAAFRRSHQGIPPALERELVDFANAHNIGWIDLREQVLDDRSFRADGGHMTRTGAVAFTRLVVPELKRIGALDGGTMLPARRLAQVLSVERVGTPAPVVVGASKSMPEKCFWSIDLGRHADLTPFAVRDRAGVVETPIQALFRGEPLPWGGAQKLQEHPCEPGWLLAGKASRLMLPEDATPAEVSFRLDPTLPSEGDDAADPWWIYRGTGVRWTLEALEQGGPVRVSLATRAATAGAGPVQVRVGGRIVTLQPGDEGLVADETVEVAAGPLTIEISSAADGPDVILRRLLVEQPDARTEIVHPPVQRSVDALAGALEAGAPPSVSTVPDADGATAAGIRVPWKNFSTCSPFLVTVDGAVLPTTGDGAARYEGDMVLLPAGVDAAQASLSFDPSRVCPVQSCTICPRRVWLYPGDHIRTSLDRDARKKAVAPLEVLHLAGELLTPASTTAELHLRVSFHERVLAEATLPLTKLPEGLALNLAERVPLGDAAPVEIELDLGPDGTPALVSLRAMSR